MGACASWLQHGRQHFQEHPCELELRMLCDESHKLNGYKPHPRMYLSFCAEDSIWILRSASHWAEVKVLAEVSSEERVSLLNSGCWQN